MRKSIGIYPHDWPAIAAATKEVAGWRCIRCGHPLVACPVLPIERHMTVSTKRNQVGQGIGFTIALKTELSKGHNVSNREFFSQLVAMCLTSLACMPVSVASLVALLSPVGAVVGIFAALPVRAILPAKVIREPFEPAFVPTEAFRRRACRYSAFFATLFAAIGYFVRLASRGTKAAVCGIARFSSIGFSAPLAQKKNGISGLSTMLRAVFLLFDDRCLTGEWFATCLACLCGWSILAGDRTVNPSPGFAWKDREWLPASRAYQCNSHVGIISYGGKDA